MKTYIIENILLLVIGIGFYLYIDCIAGPVFTVVFKVIIVLTWGYLCRRIIVLPYDIIIGSQTQIVYYATHYNKEEFEFFRESYSEEWVFYTSNNKNITLLTLNKNNNIYPKCDKKIKIVYYKFSKILLQWEYQESNTSNT